MAKNKKEITHLNYGELHMYYPIKFDTKLSLSKLCDALSKSNVSFNKEYQQKIMDSLGVSLANTVNDFHQNMPCTDMDDIALSFKVRNFETNKIYQPHPGYKPAYEINAETIRIELLSSDSSIYLNVVNTELEALQQRISRMQKEFELSDKIYGNSFTSNQERILLLPFKAKLSNDKIV